MKSTHRELEWSWERSPDWRGQYERLRRARQRVLRAGVTRDLDETFDLLLAFFITAYHLRDWLLRSGKVEQAALEALFRSSEEMQLCADLANIAKHYDLTNKPRRVRQLSIAREYASRGCGWFGDDAVLVVLSQGKHYDLRDLAASCEATWTTFLCAKGLMVATASAS